MVDAERAVLMSRWAHTAGDLLLDRGEALGGRTDPKKTKKNTTKVKRNARKVMLKSLSQSGCQVGSGDMVRRACFHQSGSSSLKGKGEKN